jgi:hypothetical protein
MHFTETAPQQSEHFEWINAFERFQSYLDVVQRQVRELSRETKLENQSELQFIEDSILDLRNEVYQLSYAVSEHIDEAETIAVADNRLDLDFQVVQHNGLRDRFSELEEGFNVLRQTFNTFYTRYLCSIDDIPQIPV